MMNKTDLYNRKIQRLLTKIARLDAVSKRFSLVRFIIFMAAIVGAIFLYVVQPTYSVWFLLCVFLIFNVVAFFHRRIDSALQKFRLWLKMSRDQLSRLQINWNAIPLLQSEPVDPQHPFDKDLNITGRFSLLQLLDLCISRQGRERLTSWLLNTRPKRDAIIQRQNIIQELVTSSFIDRLRLSFMLVGQDELDGKHAGVWLANTQSSKKLAVQLVAAFVFWSALVVLFFADLFGVLASYWGYALVAYLVFVGLNKNVWQNLSKDAEFLDMEFKQAMAVFTFLEKASFHQKPHLQNLCQAFTGKNNPSAKMRTMTIIAAAIGLRMNYLIWIFFNVLLPWDFICAFWINREKQKMAGDFHLWLETCYELEALCSLANLARLDHSAHLPEICDTEHIHFQNIGHPFIPQQHRVCNDYQIPTTGYVDLITGSNMSGKSTFLRTVGINLVLAYAGGFVIADECRIPLLQVFACVQVDDSLTRGLSQFYAEVKRLKQLNDTLDQAQDIPIFFMIDEIYKGTNNRERLIGGRSFIRRLVQKNGSGVVTTHDLELTHLEKDLTHFRNFHFREYIENHKLAFDYKLKTGPCPTTNALKIMQIEGLPVDGLSNETAA